YFDENLPHRPYHTDDLAFGLRISGKGRALLARYIQQNQPHAHIMMSQRVNDGIERTPEQYFRRYNARYPERGGAKKDSG
ncbi:hypothetical protein ML378_26340, partial [Escherichia coli]|nr:hypothetical protein [Escherichia coli]MCI4509694.1 hypothetical protein [Escherichia coli]